MLKKSKFLNIKIRYKLIYSIFLLLILIILMKITFLHTINSKKLIHESDIRSIRKKDIVNYRGKIHDRFGKIIAFSKPVHCIWLNPKEINKNDKNWENLSKILFIKLDNLFKKVIYSKKSFMYLARQLDDKTTKNVLNLKLNGVYSCNELKRFYPESNIFSSIIGITDIDGNGIEGIEKSFNDILTGKKGGRIFRKDLNGNVIENLSFTESKSPKNIFLSIDARFQSIIYHELNNAINNNRADYGSAILIDINTGEILAMVNSYYNDDIYNIKKNKIRNFSIHDVFEPGSTIKPIVIMTALKNKIVNKNSIIDTKPFIVHGHEIKDVIRHDKLSLTEILRKSSNVGVSKLSLSMSIYNLLESYSLFGLNQLTNLGLIGENIGFYPKKKMVRFR